MSGTVTDEHGTPIGSSQVHALQPVTTDGQRKLVEAPFPYQYGVTDERGQYRIYGLPAGQYAVIASGGPFGGDVREITQAELDAADREIRSLMTSSLLGPSTVERPAPIDAPSITRLSAYRPGGTDPGAAQVIALRPAEEREGLDIVIPVARAARIDGISLGPDGQPLEGAMIGVANLSTNSMYASPGLVRPAADGRFSLGSLAPSTYLFYARGSTAPGAATMGVLPLWAEVEVPLSGQDVSGVVLQFAPGRTVTGRLDFGGRPVPDLTGRMVGSPSVSFHSRDEHARARRKARPGWHVCVHRRRAGQVSCACSGHRRLVASLGDVQRKRHARRSTGGARGATISGISPS